MNIYTIIAFASLCVSSLTFIQALDVQLTNKTRKPVIVKILTEATRSQDLLTIDKQSIEGVRNSSHIQDIPIWRGTTIKAIRPGATLLIKQVHPIAESITVDKQVLSLTNLSNAQERSSKTIAFAIVPGSLWGIKFERLSSGYAAPGSKASSIKEVGPRTTEYLTAVRKTKPVLKK